jgi:hypothetical protein
VLRISKRPEPVNIVHRPSCIWHEPFCYSRQHRPTPKNTLRGNPGCAVGPKTPTKVTSLTAFEAGALPPCFTLGGIFSASFECGLEALDDKRHFILVEPDSVYLCYLACRPGQKEPEPRNRTKITENRNRTNRTEGTVMKFGSGFLRTEINEIFSVLHSKEPKEPKEPKKPKSIRFNLLHVFVTSDVVLSTYVEPLIIHVLSMKL